MLQLNEKWRINADRYNWILEHRRVAKATGVEMWYAYSYHNSLPQAINKFCVGVLKNKVNKTNIDLEAFLKAIEDLKEVVNKACENINQDTLKELTISENKKKSNSKELVVYDESDDDDELLDDCINEFVAKMEGKAERQEDECTSELDNFVAVDGQPSKDELLAIIKQK